MKRRCIKRALAGIAIAAFCAAPMLHAESLHTPARHARTAAFDANMPSRGMRMNQVRRRFGAPIEVLAKAGGDTRRHPTINRWRYTGYTVYFERDRVIHSVRDGDAAPPRA